MAYITKFEQYVSKNDLIDKLKSRNNREVDKVRDFKIGDFIFSGHNDGYIHGKIAVKREIENFEFDLNEDYEIEQDPVETYIYDEVGFTIFPDLRIISFSNKSKAKLFGMEVLSNLIFEDGGKGDIQ